MHAGIYFDSVLKISGLYSGNQKVINKVVKSGKKWKFCSYFYIRKLKYL
jgi:hypothetical protein